MLIEFSVENHRSFRERQTFSMVASTDRSYGKVGERDLAHTKFSTVPYVLREACVFGANGAGKSTLINAMGFMSKFVLDSPDPPTGRGLDMKPFLFHSEWRDKPSEYEVIFIHKNTLYQYGFSLTRQRVETEWLFARPRKTGRDRLYFTREFNSKINDYEWNINGAYLKGNRNNWKSQTREYALFLSTAAHLNPEGLWDVYDWITNYIQEVPQWSAMSINMDTIRLVEATDAKYKVMKFMERGGIHLHDIRIEKNDASSMNACWFKEFPGEARKAFGEETMKKGINEINRVYFIRKTEESDIISSPLISESTGTLNLFNLAGYILIGLEYGHTILVDSLSSEIHTLAIQNIIDMFCDGDVNENNAQLIFTTHDTTITRHNGINRDQIWMLEKKNDLASRLVPFSDFKDSENRPFQESYLQGRLGGVPRYWRIR